MKRTVGNAERACLLIDQIASMQIATVARILGPLEPEQLVAGLQAVQRRHPLLAVAVLESEPGRPVFSTCARPIPLRLLPRPSDSEWQAVAEAQRAEPLPLREGPLLRVTALCGAEVTDLIITMHHALSDGMSGVYLVADLLGVLGLLAQGQPPLLASLPLRPALEELLPASFRGPRLLSRGLGYARRLLGTALRRPTKLAEEAPVPLRDRRSRFRHHRLPPTLTRSLLGACRARGTTLHGALCASLLQAVSERLRPSPRHPSYLGCCTPVNLRELLGSGLGAEIGLYVGPAVTFHEVSPSSSLWGLAREVRDETRREKDTGGVLTAIAAQSRLLPRRISPEGAAQHLYHPLFGAVAVTNLGALALPERYGPLRLATLHFAPANNALGSLVSLAVTSFADEMSLNFNYNCGVLSESTVDSVVAATLDRLRFLAAGA